MAKNQIANGNVIDYPVAATKTSGQAFLVGDLLAVAVTDGAVGDVIAVAVQGVFEIPKRTHASTAAITQGSKVYWDDTNKVIDNTDNSAANKHIGWAYAAAITTAGTVQVKLLG